MKKKQRENSGENASGDAGKECKPSSIRLGEEITAMVANEISNYLRLTGGNISTSEFVRRAVALYLKLPSKVRDRLLELSNEMRMQVQALYRAPFFMY